MIDDIPELDKAFAAGWFEGRGYIRIGCQKGRKPRLTAYISMPSAQAPWFMERWSGRCNQQKSNFVAVSTTVYRTAGGGYSWSAERLDAFHFLNDIAPYVTTRKEFVKLSIEFIDRTILQQQKIDDTITALVDRIRVVGKLRV